MIILIGPSASGKTEVARELVETKNYKKLVTYTTRAKRPLEVDGIDYHFISTEEFKKKIDENQFFEYVSYNSNLYGTLKEDIKDDKVVILEPNGFKNYHNSNIPNLVSFYLDSKEEPRIERMKRRGDEELKIKERIESDRTIFDISKIDGIDFIIDSDSYSITEIVAQVVDLYERKLGKKF